MLNEELTRFIRIGVAVVATGAAMFGAGWFAHAEVPALVVAFIVPGSAAMLVFGIAVWLVAE